MRDDSKIKRRITYINWAFAFILATELLCSVWLMLGGWPLHGWLRRFTVQSPVLVAVISGVIFCSVLLYHRPRPLPSWASPDDYTLRYGLNLCVFCGIGVIVLALIRVFRG